jgi:lipopolysaccharide/colanic/teichoic acid biosynthesis glycosyltransferase
MYLPTDKRYVVPSHFFSDREGTCKKYKHDPSVTRVGRIIRKLSLDEFPQLFNVLKGNMLLAGPRPALSNETDAYNIRDRQRLEAIPCMTGLWQISGRADTIFEEQVELDLQ